MESPSTGGSSCHAARSPTASSSHARRAIEGKRPSYDASVRLVSKWRTILFEAEMEEAKALAMLEALGLDPGSKRAEFNGSSPLYATRDRTLAMAARAHGARWGWAAAIAGHFHLHSPFAGFSFMAAMMLVVLLRDLSSKIALGSTGS